MKIISFICLSLFSSYAFSDSCQKTFSNLKTKTKASIEIAQTEAFQSNTKISKLKSKTKISTSKISNIYFREKFQDEKYTLKYLQRMDKISSIKKITSIYPVLTGKEQIELIKIYQEYQDQRSLYILLFSNFKLIHKIAREKIGSHYYKFDDYFQEGTIAFLKAIKTFDPDKGIMFSTYLGRAIRNNLNGYGVEDHVFKIKTEFRHKIRVLDKERQENSEMFNKDQEAWIENTIKKYSKENFTKEKVKEMLLYHFDKNKKPIYEFPNASINKNRTDNEGEDVFVIENYEDVKNYDDLHSLHSRRDINKINEWMQNKIKSRPNRKVLKRIWKTRMFYFEKTKGLAEIGKEFKISHARVGTLENQLRAMVKEYFGSSKNF